MENITTEMINQGVHFVEVDSTQLNGSFANGFRDGATFMYVGIATATGIVALT